MTITNPKRRTLLLGLAGAGALAAPGCAQLPAFMPPQGMAISATPLYGKFIWRDLLTEDPALVKPFYAGLFGWQFEEGRALDAPYTLVKSGGLYIAGISQTQRKIANQPVSQWLNFMSVEDVDRVAEATRSAGGSVVMGPLVLPRVGRGAVVLDPQGAPLGLLRTSFGDPADVAEPVLNRFLWTELLASDPEAAVAFYSGLVGFESRRIEDDGRPYWLLKAGRERAGVLKNPLTGVRPVWLASVRVDEPAASATRALQLGGRVLLAPRPDVRKGTLALVADPGGAVLALQKWPV